MGDSKIVENLKLQNDELRNISATDIKIISSKSPRDQMYRRTTWILEIEPSLYKITINM